MTFARSFPGAAPLRGRRLASRAFWLAVAVTLASACKSKPAPSEPAASATPSAAQSSTTPHRVAPRCRNVDPPKPFVVGEAPRPAKPADGKQQDDSAELGLPFAIEIGIGVSMKSGFAVSGLRAQSGGSGAFVALVGADGSGRVLDLGRTYGDADPPRLAAKGERLMAVVPDNDAGGGRLRLAAIDVGRGSVTWGAELDERRDASPAMGIELGDARGVVVWDELEGKKARGVIRGASFDLANVASATEPRALSPETSDAEMPRIVARPGGFWLAWLTRAEETNLKKPRPNPAPPVRSLPAAPASSRGADDGDDAVLRVGRRALQIVPLDANGTPTSAPRAITPPAAHVLIYDLAPAADGGALLAWRDDDTAPGTESGAVEIAHVGTGGAIERHRLEDDQSGGGVPSLVVDHEPKPRAGVHGTWLALGSVNDAMRLAALAPDGRPLGELVSDPLLESSEPLAIHDGRLFVARPRGMAVELGVVRCDPTAVKSSVDGGAAGNDK